MARSAQYQLPKSGRSRSDDPRGMEAYIREAARKNGVDPDTAVKVAKSEGLRDFLGDNGKSGGAFQLYTGGGLGNKFKKETGLDPLDPANEKATIDYAMKEAAKGGWGPWYGAAKVGVGDWDGIGAAPKMGKVTVDQIQGADKVGVGETAAPGGGIGSDAAASERAATKVAGTDISTITPEVAQQATASGATGDWLDKLKDTKGTASQGLSEAIQGLGQAVASSGLAKDTTPARAAPVAVAPTPPQPQVVPMVDPRAVENQRQQLALAMQRLNSGRLY